MTLMCDQSITMFTGLWAFWSCFAAVLHFCWRCHLLLFHIRYGWWGLAAPPSRWWLRRSSSHLLNSLTRSKFHWSSTLSCVWWSGFSLLSLCSLLCSELLRPPLLSRLWSCREWSIFSHYLFILSFKNWCLVFLGCVFASHKNKWLCIIFPGGLWFWSAEFRWRRLQDTDRRRPRGLNIKRFLYHLVKITERWGTGILFGLLHLLQRPLDIVIVGSIF